ncbi:MAG: porin [Proteobacteria bacterium]|nr:porin [Pseudomonadota bacterium]
MSKKLLTATALTALALAGSNAFVTPAYAQEAGVSARISKLEQEIALLKRQQEVDQEKSASAAEKNANVEFGKKGLKITSPDKKYELSLKGYYQLDSRQFLNDNKSTGRDEIISRRLRPILEGRAGDASFRLMPDFAGNSSSPRVFDAHVDYKLDDAVQFRLGKFKPPVGLERLQSATDIDFIERGHANNLAPNRDLGFMIYGNAIPDLLEYQIGVFNGGPDLGNTDNDADDKKDLVARIFATPFHNSDIVPLQGFGAGIAGTIGDREGSATNTILGTYKTPGQQDFFKYRSDTYASGEQWRLYPQAYWYNGSFGAIGEYAISNQDVRRGAVRDTLQHDAWNVALSYVLTGEDASFKGGVKPAEDVSFETGGIGAWEVVARAGATDVDNKTFAVFADPNAAASKAQSYGVGLNWYVNENFKLATDYDFTSFDGGATGGRDRPNEQALFSRAQFRF